MVSEAIKLIVQYAGGVIVFLGISSVPQVSGFIKTHPLITIIIGAVIFIQGPKLLSRA